MTASTGVTAPKRRGWATAAALFLAASTAGCAVYSPPTITARTGAVASGSSVQLVADDATAGLRTDFAASLGKALAQNRFQMDDEGTLVADYAIATRDADTSLSGEGAADPATPQLQSGARDSHWLDKCNADRLRATLAMFDRASGTMVYRGEAETDICRGAGFAIDALAELLVEDMLSSR